MLHDPRHNLQGKPDMVYANGRRLIPVELKSGRIGDRKEPRTGDMMQLAVYFLLAEAEWGNRPKKGYLIYRDGMFVIKNTRAVRRKLKNILDEMEKMASGPEGFEGSPGFQKCKHCPCRGTVCEFNEVD
jgi:CRISPR-associated exonuclease Cas4